MTPTTKDEHDRPISPTEIVQDGFMTAEDWEVAADAAMRLYEYGVKVAAQHGLILVDTKYEFGKDAEGNIVLVDEVHTPDSNSYEERFSNRQEPENIDKEFLRLWFVKNSDPYNDKVLPKAPEELIVTLASRYIQLYEMITGNPFQFAKTVNSTADRIMRNIAAYLT
jgi:phosphoribosylaminoimidazole-succinocarboxamide synthase